MPTAYAVKRGGAGEGRRRRGRHRQAEGPRPAAFALAAEGRRRALPRVRRAAREPAGRVDVDCSQARGAGVDPEDPPLRWEVGRRGGTAGSRPRWSRISPAASTTARGRSSSSARRKRASRRSRASGYWVCCRLDDQDARRAPRRGLHPPARDPLDHGVRRSARSSPPSTRRGRRGEALGRERRHARARRFELRYFPVLDADRRRSASRSATRARTAGSSGSEVESFVESKPDDRHFMLDRTQRPGRARAGDPHAGRRLAPVRRVPPKGADAADEPLPPRRRAARQRRRRDAERAEKRDPRRRLGDQPDAGLRRRRPRVARSARTRAAMEIRTRYRAVTPEDFEFLCGEASPRVARAVCLRRPRRRPDHVHVLPRVAPADRS